LDVLSIKLEAKVAKVARKKNKLRLPKKKRLPKYPHVPKSEIFKQKSLTGIEI